jgi:hypothetical protein
VNACDQLAWKTLKQADARALRREAQIARRWRADIAGIGIEVEQVRNECGRRSAQTDMLDTAGDLRLGEFVNLNSLKT